METKRYFFTFVLITLLSTFGFAQVGINTSNPKGVFHIDGAKDNPSTGEPSASQQLNDVVIDQKGNMGIGITKPTNKFHIKGNNPIRLEGTKTGNVDTDSLVVKDDAGIIKTVGPLGSLSASSFTTNSAVFKLKSNQLNFLNGMASGESQVVPMTPIENNIKGLTYDLQNNTITIPRGIYMMIFVYEATHNRAGCTTSSYYVDFPADNRSAIRIHSTASHSSGVQSNHGGDINYVIRIANTRTFPVRLGRGVSGNCSGPGMTLISNSTQLLIFRIGDYTTTTM